jgi:uncharacterized membrane protein YkvA (DUF1232 family)
MQIITKLKELVRTLKREIVLIYYAMMDKRTPIIAKVLAGVTIGYILSPIDLIPDFVPVLGLIDDLILVPILIKLTLHFIPKELIEEIKNKIESGQKLPKKWYFAIPIVLIYIVALYFVSRFLFK